MSNLFRFTGLSLLTLVSASAATFSATSGSASVSNNSIGSVQSTTFHVLGPQVDVIASSATVFTIDTLQVLNTPFNLSPLALLISDIGAQGGGPDTVGGVTYPSVTFLNTNSGLTINALAPLTLSTGNLTVVVPATLTGFLAGCLPTVNCTQLLGGTTNPFNVNVALTGSLTVTYSLFNPPVGRQYTLTSAVFTTDAPEPGTWFSGVGLLGIVAIGWALKRNQSRSAA